MSRPRSRPPLDPRLLRYSPTARTYIGVGVLLAVVEAVAIIVSAGMVSAIAAELITEPGRRSIGDQGVHLVMLTFALIVRVAMTFGQERYAHRAAAKTIAELRARVLDTLTDPTRHTPRGLVGLRERATTVVLRGLDGVGPYLSGYVPALIVSAVVTPVVVIVIGFVDWPSALIILITLPLIPVFMILVGLMTRDRTERKLATMTKLSSQLLDLISGLPTLRALNRAQAPAGRVAELGAAHKRSTMSSLRVAFLSGAVLELIATLCVALVAVGIGLRLVNGSMELYAGLFALILAPEAYLPLRRVGAQFHNSEDGLTAVGEVFDLIGRPGTDLHPTGSHRTISVAGEQIRLLDVGVHGRDGWAPYQLSTVVDPGAVTVFTGPNGAGKSTALATVMGLVAPDDGSVLVGSVSVAELEPEAFHEQLAWLPQHPVIVPGTVADNLALFGALDPDALQRACVATGFDQVLAQLPDGTHTVLGAGGVGLSAGQRQRLALTRVLAAPAPLLLLDEPTAHLDATAETTVLAALRERARAGDTVLVVAHRHLARDFADRVVYFPEVVGVG
ncbi:thiol reductant ABC exporter subunit CydD [Gordonia sp. ABSL1-1]|uniref:thiol reductant ABC exporter subunit CydD n=1 Tax=Gordonia sp. ABSL1-1 TaxID=3053923 RepID=UPI00257467BA|nr:thiol reductant ABC exporter subunit CydD [Gordonia sp. ABSL1-1]MDL9936164.1 thiol reductant ABC exporter subunit CydD [Gordonia sp. ABSL1-1]